MFSSKMKALVIVSALLLTTALVTVGCRSKVKGGMVNTDSLPGHRYSKYVNKGTAANHSKTTVVYLGSEDSSSNANFGPQDVSFEFKDLK